MIALRPEAVSWERCVPVMLVMRPWAPSRRSFQVTQAERRRASSGLVAAQGKGIACRSRLGEPGERELAPRARRLRAGHPEPPGRLLPRGPHDAPASGPGVADPVGCPPRAGGDSPRGAPGTVRPRRAPTAGPATDGVAQGAGRAGPGWGAPIGRTCEWAGAGGGCGPRNRDREWLSLVASFRAADLEAAWHIARACRPAFEFEGCASFALMERLGIHETFTFDTRFPVYRFGPNRQRPLRRLPS